MGCSCLTTDSSFCRSPTTARFVGEGLGAAQMALRQANGEDTTRSAPAPLKAGTAVLKQAQNSFGPVWHDPIIQDPTAIHLQSRAKTRGGAIPLLIATTSSTTPSSMRVIANVLLSGKSRPRLATGQHRGSVSAIFSRDLAATQDHVGRLNGTLVSDMLPWTR